MRHYFQHLIGTIVLSILMVCIALGGGYQLNEQGARATGMGGAFVARASDPSAIYYNPAGLAYQKGINTLVGMNLVIPSIKFKGTGITNPEETSTNSMLLAPINLYGSYQLNDDIVVGLGIYNPFISGIDWPLLWGQTTSGTWLGINKAKKFDIKSWYFNPSAAYKISDELSIGLGISFVYTTANWKTEMIQINGSGYGYNVNIGALYKLMEDLSIGISYRINTDIELDNSVSYAGGLRDSLYPGGTGKATLPLPGNLIVGAAYQLMPDLTIEGDIQYTQWSAYNQLKIDVTPVVPTGQGPITQTKKWEDAITARGGAEYKLSPEFVLRAGVILELSPQPLRRTEPMIPDGDRVSISIGGSYKVDENLSVDAAYMLSLLQERNAKSSNSDGSLNFNEAGIPGIYNGTTHTFSINFGYAF